MMRRLSTRFASGLVMFACTVLNSAFANDKIIVQSTTSTKNSGLYDYILPLMKEDTGVTAHVVAVGTGAAIKNAMNCDGDVLLVHSRQREDKFVAEGYARQRYDVMYNDYVIVGPQSDPAGIADLQDGSIAFNKIAETKEQCKGIEKWQKSEIHFDNLVDLERCCKMNIWSHFGHKDRR